MLCRAIQLTVFTLLMLAFVEAPSSLRWTSDPRSAERVVQPPWGATESVEMLCLLVHPFAPHAAEEIWERLGHEPSVQRAPWPSFDPALCEDEVIEVPVQINGKVRARITLAKDADEATALAAAEAAVADQLEGKTLVKRIWVPGRIVTLVAK